MPPKRSNAASKAVEDERDGGGASAKRKSGFIPRKIVRGEVESGPAAPPAAAGPSAAFAAAAAAGDTAVGATTTSVAAIATAAAISAASSKAVSASTSSGRTATAAGQPSVSNAPTVGLELLPAKRTRVASMKARELAERKRSGVLERSSDSSDDDEPYVRGDGDNDIDYNSPGRRRLSAGKRGRRRRSATVARATENDFDDSENAAVLASKSKRIVKKTPKRSFGSPSKQPVEAAVTAAVPPAAAPAIAAGSPQAKSLASQPSDPLPVTVAVIMASDSAASGAADRLPVTQSSSPPSVGIVRVLPAATTTTTAGSAPLPPAVQSSPNVVPFADAAAIPPPAAPSEPVGESYVLSSAALPTAASVPLDAVPLVVVEAADGFQQSNLSGESAGAVAGILMDQVVYPSQGMREYDDAKQPSAEENESEQPSQPPVTVAALNDDDGNPGDQGSQARLINDESNPPETAIDGAAYTAASVSQMLSASGELSSVTAAQVLSALSAIGSRSDGGISEGAAVGGSSGRRPGGVRKDGRSAAGGTVSAAQLTDGATAAAVGDRAQSAKPKTVECSTCHKLVRRYDLNKHIKNVHSGDKPNKCPHCDYASPWKGNLNTHIAGVHLKARSHECTRCKLMFKTRGAMIGHVRKVHDRMYQPTERNFECEECHKKFFKKFHLQRHERVHTGEKPYLCVYCGKKFTSKTNMDTHIQSVHLKIKPFRCGYCEKGFGRKKLMLMHVRKYHIPNAPMGELTDDDEDEEDVDDDEVDEEELSDGQAPAAEGATTALLNSIVHSAATPSSSLAATAAAAGVSAAVPGSSSSASATAAQAATRLVYLRMPDGKETAAQAVKQYVVIRQEQVHVNGAGDVAVDHRAGSSTAASMDSTFSIAVDGNSSGHSANSSAAIVWQPAAAASGDGAEGAGSLQQQQQTVRQQQQLNTSANIVWQFEQMPAGSVLQAVQASDGTVILLATPASPSSLASVAGGHQQLAVVPSADGTPETILAVETVAVSADALLASRDSEAEQQRFPSDGTA